MLLRATALLLPASHYSTASPFRNSTCITARLSGVASSPLGAALDVLAEREGQQ